MKKIVLPAIIAAVAMSIVGFLFNMIPAVQAQYQGNPLFRPWSDPLMSLFFIYPLVLAFVLAWIYNKTKSLQKSKSAWTRGLNFGLSYSLIATLPGMLITFSSFAISPLIIIVWTLTGVLDALIAGFIFAKMNR